MSDIAARPTPVKAARIMPELLAGLAAAGLVLTLALAGGFAGLVDLNGDSDSLMRLVEVRDLLAGQAWFDTTQVRMGLDGGFVMHWSRLVDAPIAVLAALLGEPAALVIWPTLLAGITVFLLARMARLAHGEAAVFPAAAVGTLALVSIGIVRPGAIDHHNIQLALTLGMAAGLMAGGARAGLAAGACAALTLAVGMETLPYVAAGGTVAALFLLPRGRSEAGMAGGFGFGFAVTALAAFVATVPPARWMAPACDAFSVAQLSVALVAGLGLALAAVLGSGSLLRRASLLGFVAAAVAVLAVSAFPQCLGDPYAGLDPRLRRLWLDGVVEAQSILKIARLDLAMLATWYATPLLGLVVLVLGAARRGWRRADAVVGAMLGAAILVSLWQVRGGVFAVALAVVPLSGWIAARRAASPSGTASATFALAAAWILSFNAVWSAAGERLVTLSGGASTTRQAETSGAGATACLSKADYARLAALPPTTVVAVSNLGSPILAHTPHRVLAGPYHRNVAGNLAALDLLLATPEEAWTKARRHGVGIVALCPGNSETNVLAREAPGGLTASLLAGTVPDWLDPLDTAGALKLYRVRP